jgi:hypothetical protein
MSWDVVRSQTDACWCGKGTITHVLEMDDWNRTREHSEFNCSDCETKHREQAEARQQKEEKKEALFLEAQKIAADRYLTIWLNRYAGLSKKEAWQQYTGGTGYPSLGTFYKHVQHAGGLTEYMTWCFDTNFPGALQALSVNDPEIQKLLAERDRL